MDGRADTIVPDPGDPQALNRYSYVLNNPVRYTDPTGMFSTDEIEQYLRDHYGDMWQNYWDAWQADPLWWWVLSEAQGGDILSVLDTSGQTWQLSFEAYGSGFGLFAFGSNEEHLLHWWQGTGYMELYRSPGETSRGQYATGQKLTYPGLGVGDTAGLLSVGALAGDAWSPIYDYSAGVPTFTGEWNHISTKYEVTRWTPGSALARGLRSASIPFTWLLAKVGLGAPTVISGSYTVVMMIDSMAVSQANTVQQDQNPWPLPIKINPNGGTIWPQ